MDPSEKNRVLKELQRIPGVGKCIAGDLWDLGIRKPDDLKLASPEEWYERLCALQHCRLDRCMLYVLRCADYFVKTPLPDPEKLKWWHWKME